MGRGGNRNPAVQADLDAADEIERLRAELNRRVHPGQGEGYALEEDRLREVVSTLRAEVTARDALIAEALAILSSSSVPLGADALWQQGQVIQEARNILSRILQDAIDRRGEAGDGPSTTDDPVPLGSDQRVAPDREALAFRLFRLDVNGPDEEARSAWEASEPLRSHWGSRADALIASGVLGVAPDREVLVKAIMEMHLPGGSLRPSDAGILAITLIESGVFGVSADLIRAETLEKAAEGLAGPSIPLAADWLRRRAAEYRKAADHG